MNFDVEKRTIFLGRHGSHAYGLNVATSDTDVKGICIEPLPYHLGSLHRFEQYERMGNSGGGDLQLLKSFVDEPIDLVIYSLKKFVRLAADCNPNIIEILYIDDSDIIFMNKFGERLREARDLFLSQKARFTFAGYAHTQLKRIKTHRSWLLNPPTHKPTREEYNLSQRTKATSSELGLFEDTLTKGTEVKISAELYTVLMAERSYKQAMMHWDQYMTWKKKRNPARAALEAEYGYDTKHGMHLLRLMRMCKEIMLTGHVLVKRPDRDDLLAVRYGQRSYDDLVEEAEQLEEECAALYGSDTCHLPKNPPREKLDKMLVDLTEEYCKMYG